MNPTDQRKHRTAVQRLEARIEALELLVAQICANENALMEAMNVAVEAAHAPEVLPASGD